MSRGLLHYYFGTKEALLVEVVRRDTEHRITRLDQALAGAGSANELLDILVAGRRRGQVRGGIDLEIVVDAALGAVHHRLLLSRTPIDVLLCPRWLISSSTAFA